MFKVKLPILALSMSLLIPQISNAAPLKILPLGDSITNDNNLDPSKHAYRDELYDLLTGAGFDFEYVGSSSSDYNGITLNHEGVGGIRADQIVSGGYSGNPSLVDKLQGYDADIVLLHIGTNDLIQSARGSEPTTPAVTLQDIEDIIAALQLDNPNVTVLVAKIIPSDETEVTTVELNDLLTDAWANGLSNANSTIQVVDHYSGFGVRDYHDGSITSNELGIHPDASGEEKMAQRWYEAIVGPQKYSDLKLWLDGSYSPTVVHDGDYIVDQWSDRSGRANHVTPIAGTTEPRVSTTRLYGDDLGLTTLKFDGSGLETATTGQITADSSYTKFVVFKQNNPTASSGQNLVSSDVDTATLFYTDDGQLHARNGMGDVNGNSGGSAFITSSSNITSEYNVGAILYGNPNNIDNSLRLNLQEVGTNTEFRNHALAKTNIGSLNGGGNLQGEIAEVLIYDRALLPNEITEVENYLYSKWIGSTVSVDPNLTLTSAAVGTVSVPYTITNTSDSSGAVTYTTLPAAVCTNVDGAVTFHSAGVCNVEATQVAATGYTGDSAVLSVIVASAPDPSLEITSETAAIVGTPYTITNTSDSSGTVTYTVSPAAVCTNTGDAVTLHADGACIINATQAAAPGYSEDTAVLTVNVANAPIDPALDITSGSSATVGSAYTIATSSQSSGAISFTTSPAAVCSNVGTAVTLVSAGTCNITANQVASAGYLADTAVKAVIVSDAPVDPSLTVTSVATANVGASYMITHTSDSSGTVSYSVSPAAVCTNQGATVTLLSAGSCSITVNQAASTGYLADTATVSLTVSATADPDLKSVTDIITGNSSGSITTQQLEAIGITGVKSDIDYTAALKAYSYNDPDNPTVAEIQKAVTEANEDSINTGSSGGGAGSPFLLMVLFAALYQRRRKS